MVLDLVRAALAAAAAGVLPGYFWAVVLRPTGGLAERLTYAIGFVFVFALLIWITGFDVLRQISGNR